MRSPSSAVSAMPRSGIRDIFDIAGRTDGVIHLEIGEPNYPTPDHIIEAAAAAGRAGFTKYTANRGLLEVREAMGRKIATHNGFEVDVDDIVITSGALNGLLGALMVLLDPGETVLLPDPAWPNYMMMAGLVGARVERYPLDPEHDFEPDMDAFEAIAATTNAKVLVVNTPGNPTGAVFTRQTLERITDVARRHDLWIVSDECYDALVFDGEHTSLAALDDPGRVVSVFSVSKTYAMTGWRIGYVAAPPRIADLMSKVQEAMIGCATAVSQKAAQAALEGDQSCVETMRAGYRARRDRAVEMLSDSGLLASRPHGAFYVMATIGPAQVGDVEFCRRLIVDEGVAVAPGVGFGPAARGMVRISLATDEDHLVEGLRRLIRAVQDGA